MGSTLFSLLYSTEKLLEIHEHRVTIYAKEQRKKHDSQKKGTLNAEISNFTLLVLNQSSISAVPLIVRCPRDQKTALMGDPLYYYISFWIGQPFFLDESLDTIN